MPETTGDKKGTISGGDAVPEREGVDAVESEEELLRPLREKVEAASEAFLDALASDDWGCHTCGHAITKPAEPRISEVWDQVGRRQKFSGSVQMIAHCGLERDGRISLDSRFRVSLPPRGADTQKEER